MSVASALHQLAMSDVPERRESNARAAISQLNYDILVSIFMMNTVIDLEDPHVPSQTTRWTSHVQHSWREMMLDSPILWAAVLDFGDPPRWIAEVMRRARSAPFEDVILPSLTPSLVSREYRNSVLRRDIPRNGPKSIPELLHLLVPERVDEKHLGFVLPLLPRCRRFVVKITKDRWKQLVVGASVPAPLLHTFAVVVKGSQLADYDMTFANTFLGGQAPRLRVLDLRGCIFDLTSPVLRGLTSLIVRRPSSFRLPSPSQWLSVLAQMPSLIELDLSAAFSSLEGFPSLDPVTLPNLSSLSLLGNLTPCALIISHLRFPPLLMLDVRCYRTVPSAAFAALAAVMHSALRSLSSHPDGLTLSTTPTGLGFTLRSLTSQKPTDPIFSLDCFTRVSQPSQPGIASLLPAFLQLLRDAAQGVQNLRIDLIASVTLRPDTLLLLLVPFRQVRKVHLAMSDTVGYVLPILSSTFPFLHTLVIEHAFALSDDVRPQKVADTLALSPSLRRVEFSHCAKVADLSVALQQLGLEVEISKR